MHDDTGTNEPGEGRELRVNQIPKINSLPFIPDQQVLIGGKGLDAFGEALDEVFGILGGSLLGDRVHDAEHVLGAMIDFAHEEVFFFLALLAFGNVLSSATETHDPSLRPGTFKIREPMTLYPADRPVLPPNPELMA